MSFYHTTIKCKGKFSWEPHGSLDSTTIYFPFNKDSKLWECREFYDLWLSAPAVTEKEGC